MTQPETPTLTPRTDPKAFLADAMHLGLVTVVPRSFARVLELELIAATARAAELEGALRDLLRDEKLDDGDPRLESSRHKAALLLAPPSPTGTKEGA